MIESLIIVILVILIMAKRVLGVGGVNIYNFLWLGKALFSKRLLVNNVGSQQDFCSFAFLDTYFLLPLKETCLGFVDLLV